MIVIENSQVKIPSIASREYIPAKYIVVVLTCVPLNEFSYSNGASIKIIGIAVMKLTGGESLCKLCDETAISNANIDENTPFQLKINLHSAKEEEAWTNSASTIGRQDVAMLGVISGTSYSLLR